MTTEKTLSLLYFFGTILAVTTCLSMAVVWSYWQNALNNCVQVNCGCILYGTATFSMFIGGDISLCQYVTFTPIFVIFWGSVMAAYHAYRSCISKNQPTQRRLVVVANANGSRQKFVECSLESRSKPLYLLLGILAALVVLFLLIGAIMMAHGYNWTCREYKRVVIKQLNANGDLAKLVLERLQCGTVYNFMDYLQADPIELEYRYRRNFKINTGFILGLALVSAIANCLLWIGITGYNLSLTWCNKTNKRQLISSSRSY